MTMPNRTANHSAWKYVDKREEFTGSSLRGETYRPGAAPHLSVNDTWMSNYETEMYSTLRSRVTYIVWSFATPIAYYIEPSHGFGAWYKVGQVFSSFTSRHQWGALQNVSGHRITMTGKPGHWVVDCTDCGTVRTFTRKRDAERVVVPHR